MIEMTVSQQKVFKLHMRSQAFSNVLSQLRQTSTTSSINKSGFVAQAYKVGRGVRGISQAVPAHLPEIIPYSYAHSDPYWFGANTLFGLTPITPYT